MTTPIDAVSDQPVEFDTGAKRVLVVDDQPESRNTLSRVLEAFGYEVELARDGLEALAKLDLDIDLVLLDATMPNVDGFEVARRIRAQPEHLDLPIIMVTGLDRQEDRLRAVEVGVNDFVTKPFEIAELKLRSGWLLKLKEAHDAIKRQRAELKKTVDSRTKALRIALEDMAAARRKTLEAHLDTIRRLVLATESKDSDTAVHVERIGLYSELLAERLNLSPAQVGVIRHASPMHDVGKIGIPDAILLKPGKLTGEEWEVMKQHTTIGARILHGSPSEVLRTGEVIALTHHEKWDGTGYPKGLKAEQIPLEGRICTVADVFDALTSDRHYRDSLPNEDVYEMMSAQRARHFDPEILDVFFERRDDVEAIQQEYAGPHASQMVDVLIVDDDAGVRIAFTKMLEHGGFKVTAVEHGLAALALLQQQSVRAIVCDIMLPFLEGNRFYDELAHEHPEMAERVVFVTGALSDEKIRSMVERTGRPLLRKPVGAAELLRVVRMVFEQ